MKKGEKRKQELLKIAYELFLARGYENTSVDTIIEEAGIAKGTYYYYFESKEAMLEEVCMMMIDEQADRAKHVVDSDLSVQEKLVGIIASFRPAKAEMTIADTINRPENLMMHDKINRRGIEAMIPLVVKVVEQGIEEGIFYCDNVYERVRMLLIVSNSLFDDYSFTEKDIDVFIELIEKMLGAKPGTVAIVKQIIMKG